LAMPGWSFTAVHFPIGYWNEVIILFGLSKEMHGFI